MQQGNFIDVFLARHVSGTYAHHQEHYMLSCSVRFSAPSFWMGDGLESCCVGRVCGADSAVRVARQHPHRTVCKYALHLGRTAAQYSALNPENTVASCTPTRYPTNSSKHASRNAGFHRTALRHIIPFSATVR